MPKKWTGERLETFVFNEATVEHLHRYAMAREFVKGKRVLDIACGEGYGSMLLAEEAHTVAGIDIDKRTIENAAKKYRRSNLFFLQGSVENIPEADQSFDIVISFETLEHTEEQTKMLSEIKRVLKPGGLLIISTPEKKACGSYKNPFHKKELHETEFKELLEKFFSYRVYLNQDLFVSSVIMNKEELSVYKGSYEKIERAGSIDPLYIIAFCSDNKVAIPPSSIFISKSIFENIICKKEEAVRNSITYRAGHILLFPAKMIKKLFK